jgi:hypothetical protein
MRLRHLQEDGALAMLPGVLIDIDEIFGSPISSTGAIMSYDLHLTRKAFWADEEGLLLALEEWREYVKSDFDLAQDPLGGDEDFLFVAHRTNRRRCGGMTARSIPRFPTIRPSRS